MRPLLSLGSVALLTLPAIAFGARDLLVPFDDTGCLYVLDSASGHVLRINPAGTVFIGLDAADIEAETGSFPNYSDSGIAFGPNGQSYFSDQSSNSILNSPDGSSVTTLVTSGDIAAATGEADGDPEGLAFSETRLLHVNDDTSNSQLSVDVRDGSVFVHAAEADLEAASGDSVDADGMIVGNRGGITYLGSSGGAEQTLFEIDSAGGVSIVHSGGPFANLDAFMTRGPKSDLYIADSDDNSVFRYDPRDGFVTTAITELDIQSVTFVVPDLRGGMAFDDRGFLYIAETGSGHILEVHPVTGDISIWVSHGDIEAVTGVSPELDGGIAWR